MTTKTKSKAPEQLVSLEQILNRVGGTIHGVRDWIAKADGEVVSMWDGREAIDVATAARVVRLVDEYKRRNEAIAAGYASYLQDREAEKARVRQETYQTQHDRLLAEQRRDMRAESGQNGRFLCANAEYRIGLGPAGVNKASELTHEAVADWERKNPAKTQEQWEKQARREGRI